MRTPRSRNAFEERRVLGVDVAHEVHDRVGLGRRVVVRVEERDRPPRHVLRRRGDTGRVDQGRGPQALRRPVDHEALALLGGRRTEVDLQRAVVRGARAAAGACRVRVQHDARRRAVAVPGDHTGALAGVGRCHLFPDERVEQCRLARLHLARDRDPQRLVEPAQLVVQPPGRLRFVPVRVDREQQHPAGGVGERGHPARPAATAGAFGAGRLGNQRPCLLADQLQLLQLLRDLGQPGFPLGPRRLHRAFGGLLRLQQRALELVGLRGEVVAQVALHGTQPVAGVLRDLEGDVVDVAAHRGLRLVLPACDLLLALVADRLAAHEDRSTEAERVDRRGEADERPEHAEHQHARVAAAQPDQRLGAHALCPRSWVRPSRVPTGSHPTGRCAAPGGAARGRRRSGRRRGGPARAPAGSPR